MDSIFPVYIAIDQTQDIRKCSLRPSQMAGFTSYSIPFNKLKEP